MGLYTMNRNTKDIDFIVHLQTKDVNTIVSYFGKGYYVSEDAIKDAIKRKSMFNIIDHATQFKADFFILKSDDFNQTEFNRRVKVDFFGMPVYVVTAEDLILSKLIWIQELQSAVQMEDIKNLLTLENIDRNYIRHWIKELKLNTFDFTI